MKRQRPPSGRIQPVILCGGSGTRLWPLSRRLYPKQLLPLTSTRSMLQETVGRVRSSERFHPPVVICNEEHRFQITEQKSRIRPMRFPKVTEADAKVARGVNLVTFGVQPTGPETGYDFIRLS